MQPLPSFATLVQPLGATMTAPTFRSLQTLLTGWLLARRRTITGMLVAAGVVGTRHHAAFHRVFSAARWSIDALGLAVFDLVVATLRPRGALWLTLDDTHARKYGRDLFGAGMHHDPILSTRARHVVTWGLTWVVLCVAVRLPCCPDRVFSVPVLCRLYLNTHGAARWRRTYRSKPQLAVELLTRLCAHRPERRFHALVDSSYGGQSVLAHLPANCDLTSRLDLDARLCTAPPRRRPGQVGRPRVRGTRLPTPRQMLAQRGRRVTLDLYGRRDRVRLVATTARVHKVPGRSLRIVVVEPLVGGRPVAAFFSTVACAADVQVLQWYARRWSIEETFAASKSLLGMHQPQVWCRRAVERAAPVGLLLYSLVVVWFAAVGHAQRAAVATSWYRARATPSFGDMLATLRREVLRHNLVSRTPTNGVQTPKPLATLIDLVARAA
jgi:hypothetical protein